jgi:hypothetical protein
MGVRHVLARSVVLLAAGCGGAGVHAAGDPGALIGSLSKADVERLSKKRVFFGHQSIGYNIVDGLVALEREHPELGLAVKETRDGAQIASGVFAHGRVGENKAPSSKIRDFTTSIEGGLAEKVDVAFFKFCYVDFEADTDAAKVFDEYRAAMTHLHQKFPRLTIVHVTVPLAVVQTGPKAVLKRLLGKKRWGADANIVRNQYNELLRHEYAGKEPLFDLAAVEATRADGGTASFEEGGATYPMLAAEYASDGKHLNPFGGRWVAAQLVKYLAGLPG